MKVLQLQASRLQLVCELFFYAVAPSYQLNKPKDTSSSKMYIHNNCTRYLSKQTYHSIDASAQCMVALVFVPLDALTCFVVYLLNIIGLTKYLMLKYSCQVLQRGTINWISLEQVLRCQWKQPEFCSVSVGSSRLSFTLFDHNMN